MAALRDTTRGRGTSIRLDDDHRAALETIANAERVSVSAVVRWAVAHYLAYRTTSPSAAEHAS